MQNFTLILQWWIFILIIGLVFFPAVSYVFNNFLDKGYLFSKILGIAIASYCTFLLSMLKIVKFTDFNIFLVILIFLIINLLINKKTGTFKQIGNKYLIIFFEETLFLIGIFYWANIRANEPSIHGLEKFMDFGFINSILRTEYFPPKDMWFAGLPINYYYFGHYITAYLTKLSNLPSYITFNIMLATIFSFAFTTTFSITINLISKKIKINKFKILLSGILGAALLTFGGNLHMIYAFFAPYNVDKPVPFWQLMFSPFNFPNNYWYPNATRFIPYTIHEFPIYSFVVSDLHGHVLDIPFVLSTIALIYSIYQDRELKKIKILLLSFLLAIMYMTNAWDGIIYFILAIFSILIINLKLLKFKSNNKKGANSKNFNFKSYFERIQNLNIYLIINIKYLLVILLGFTLFSFPFSLHFKPFVSGIGIICSPDFLVKIGKIGPFLFEANHCQRSTLWELFTLYGLFYFFVFSFIFFVFKKNKKINEVDLFVFMLILLSTILIIVPEFIYVKDIYPMHYRANTMFKLVYQAFIMLSISTIYIFTRIVTSTKNLFYLLICILLFGLVLYYSKLAVKSYYGDLNNYSGLDGEKYLINIHPNDYLAINWINKNIKGQPVMLEAQGDSYTDYERISANTGLPTILGWTVHEWLWRGTYDMMVPRIQEVQTIYESRNIQDIIPIITKYNIQYIYVGKMEHQKYPDLYEQKFNQIGKIVYENQSVKIYKIY